eukprot:scaffold46635_cov60-Phaeocystis_antarctica.AAC.2
MDPAPASDLHMLERAEIRQFSRRCLVCSNLLWRNAQQSRGSGTVQARSVVFSGHFPASGV